MQLRTTSNCSIQRRRQAARVSPTASWIRALSSRVPSHPAIQASRHPEQKTYTPAQSVLEPNETEDRKRHNHDNDNEFQINFGRAVDALRDDLPAVFQRAVQQEVYHPDVQLHSPWFNLHGKSSYNATHSTVRNMCRLLFSDCEMQLMRLWSPEPGLVRARCRVVCVPWGASLLRGLKGGSKSASGQEPGTQQVELLFTYKFSAKGFISEHVIERLTPIDPTPADAAFNKLRAIAPTPQRYNTTTRLPTDL